MASVRPPFSRIPGKKEQDAFSDFLLGCTAGRRQVFSFLMACQFDKLEFIDKSNICA
jgi:hypothetical protein